MELGMGDVGIGEGRLSMAQVERAQSSEPGARSKLSSKLDWSGCSRDWHLDLV